MLNQKKEMNHKIISLCLLLLIQFTLKAQTAGNELIAIGRLRAKPFAKFCTPCREIYEAEK